MKTSYFAKYKQPNGVAIVASVPFWFKFKVYKPLAPTWELVSEYKAGKLYEQEYKEIYLQLLLDRKLTPNQVLEDLGDDVVLLCYEKSNEFCHRHIAAEWLREGGIKIDEI